MFDPGEFYGIEEKPMHCEHLRTYYRVRAYSAIRYTLPSGQVRQAEEMEWVYKQASRSTAFAATMFRY